MADGLAQNMCFLRLIIDNVHLGTSAFIVDNRKTQGDIVRTVYKGVLKDKSCRGTGLPNTIIEYRNVDGTFLNAIAIFKKHRSSNVVIIK